MSIREHLSHNIRLAIPVMLSNLGHVLIGVTDNIMVGHINAVSLAAAGLALVVFNVFLLFGIGVSYAITPLVAEGHGRGDLHAVVESVRHGLVINVVNSVLLVLTIIFAGDLLRLAGQSPEVVDMAIPYLRIITVSLIPVIVFQTFKQFAEGLSNTRLSLWIMIATLLLNIFFNWILIHGHFGFPAMGLEGAGWATLASRIFMAVAIAGYIFYHPDFGVYRPIFALGNYSRAMFSRMLHLGIPSGVQFIFEVAAFDFSLVMMGWLGTQVQAAHQIAINMATISYMTTAGLAAAATIRVGYFSGKRDVLNMQRAAWSILGMALMIMFLWGIVFIGGRHLLPSFYVQEPEVILIASSLLVIAGLFQLADGAQVVCASALRGLQDVKIPSLYILLSYWVVGLPLGYLMTFKMNLGPTGIWWGLFIGLMLTACALFIRLKNKMQILSDTPDKIEVKV